MTQSDDNLGEGPSCESKYLTDKLTHRKSASVERGEKEVNPRSDTRRLSEGAKKRPNGSCDFLNPEEMGSTDSAGNTHSGGSSCGFVSSLFPNSCRGRAESFARRLHRRLTSLGGESVNTSEDEDDDSVSYGLRGGSKKIDETSWLHAPNHRPTTTGPTTNSTSSKPMEERVLDSQPRHSPESDVYYDFDLESYENARNHDEYVSNSPAEMASDTDVANIVVNRKITGLDGDGGHVTQDETKLPEYLRDSESGCVFESPLPGTSPETENSEAFFDPESSETEKTCENQTYDSRETESESSNSGVLNEGAHSIRKIHNHLERIHDDESSRSSESSSINPRIRERNSRNVENRVTSSEESLNGNRSSLETTSPSHESLWSTFDESTLSIQDESSTGQTTQIPCPQTLSKSHSDSEIIGNPSRSIDEVDKSIVSLTNGDDVGLGSNHSNETSSIDIPGGLVLECSSGRRVSSENFKSQVNSRTEETNGSESEMEKLLERLATSPLVDRGLETKNPSRNFDLEDVTNGTRDDEENEKEEKEEGEEEEEEEDNRPQRLRRCSSLKTGKTPPGTPGRKKIVRFADVLGLDLADVRTFLDEIPKIPNSAYSDLICDETFHKDSSPVSFAGNGSTTFGNYGNSQRAPVNGMKVDRTLVPLFQQPGGSPNFLDVVRERQVCLENVVVQDPIDMCIHGSVRVRNLDFHKSVHIRYTLDSWRNFSDLQATYVPNSCDGFSDKFTFLLYCHTLKIGQRLEMAVRFQCKGSQYWDNNAGVNYCFQCLPVTTTNSGYIPITAPTVTSMGLPLHGNNRDWSPTFY